MWQVGLNAGHKVSTQQFIMVDWQSRNTVGKQTAARQEPKDEGRKWREKCGIIAPDGCSAISQSQSRAARSKWPKYPATNDCPSSRGLGDTWTPQRSLLPPEGQPPAGLTGWWPGWFASGKVSDQCLFTLHSHFATRLVHINGLRWSV